MCRNGEVPLPKIFFQNLHKKLDKPIKEEYLTIRSLQNLSSVALRLVILLQLYWTSLHEIVNIS